MRRRRTWADWTRPLWRVGNRLEAWELRRLGTSGMKLLRRSDLLALETTGRRTGRRRRVPLAYWVTDEGSYMVGGGAAGMTRVDWVANLRAVPQAVVWVGRRPMAVTARELEGEECEVGRAEAFRRWPGARRYEARSGRRIPYFELRKTVEQ